MARKKAAAVPTVKIKGDEYVVISLFDYLVMKNAAESTKRKSSPSVDAHSFIRSSIGSDLRAAREHAKLTQAELAIKLGKSQTLVSQAESGLARVSERYVQSVLRACALPADWNGRPAFASITRIEPKALRSPRSRTKR